MLISHESSVGGESSVFAACADQYSSTMRSCMSNRGSFLSFSILLSEHPFVLLLVFPQLCSVAVERTIVVWLSQQTLN